MLLPDPLPTNPDELDALYEKFISQDGYEWDNFERLMEARLRAWGMNTRTNMKISGLVGRDVGVDEPDAAQPAAGDQERRRMKNPRSS